MTIKAQLKAEFALPTLSVAHVSSTDSGVPTSAVFLTSAALFPKDAQRRRFIWTQEMLRIPSHTGGRAFLKVLSSFCTRCVLFISLLTALPYCETPLRSGEKASLSLRRASGNVTALSASAPPLSKVRPTLSSPDFLPFSL